MKKIRKLTSIILALAMSASLLSACGSKPAGSSNSGSGSQSQAPTLNYPTKNINVICGYGAGGTTDLCIRGIVDAIPDGTLPGNVNILTNNVTGAAGLTGATQFVNSASDGYTLGIVNCDLILHKVNGNTDIAYDQFTPVACLMNQPNLILVNVDSQFKSLEDLVNYAKENPGALKVANSGEGGIPRLCAQAIEKTLGLDFKYINYDSDGACVTGVVAGEAVCTMVSAAAAIGQLQAGTVQIVAVSDGENRMGSYPDIPAWGEVYSELKDVNILTWVYLAVKSDVDPQIVSYLQNVFDSANATDKFKDTQKSFSIEPTTFGGVEEAQAFMKAQSEFYDSLINS